MTYLFKKISYLASFSLIAVLLLFSAGCKNDSVVDPAAGNNNLSVGYFNENTGNDNTLVLTEAKFVLRKIVFEKDDDSHGDCDVRLGPFVVYLDMSQKVVIAALTKIVPGTYREVKFQIHKPNPNESISDPEFIESTSRRYSVIAKGTYNGDVFIYKADITVVKEIEFEHAPVSISDATVMHVTISLDVISWFMNNGVIIDPRDEQNTGIIKDNIKRSFKRAFKDLDHNGEPD